jgi:thiaminase
MNIKTSAWLESCRLELVEPRKRVIENHPFVKGMLTGQIEKPAAERYFSGLMWHLLDFGKHVEHLMSKRPAEVSKVLEGRSEDKDGDTAILRRIVEALGGPIEQIEKRPWTYRAHPVWITHDALLRSAIYSRDFKWQVGAAALNVGIESLVPTMIEPLFRAATRNYRLTSSQAEWLESRSGEAEKQHGENGYIILEKYVDPEDHELQDQCRYQIDALSYSMAYRLLESGL